MYTVKAINLLKFPRGILSLVTNSRKLILILTLMENTLYCGVIRYARYLSEISNGPRGINASIKL